MGSEDGVWMKQGQNVSSEGVQWKRKSRVEVLGMWGSGVTCCMLKFVEILLR